MAMAVDFIAMESIAEENGTGGKGAQWTNVWGKSITFPCGNGGSVYLMISVWHRKVLQHTDP